LQSALVQQLVVGIQAVPHSLPLSQISVADSARVKRTTSSSLPCQYAGGWLSATPVL
jgi:hypothetical protein